MTAPITQAQLDQLLADAKLGRALREAAEATGRRLADHPDLEEAGVEHHHRGAFVAECLDWWPGVAESDAGAMLRDIVEEAAQEVEDERERAANAGDRAAVERTRAYLHEQIAALHRMARAAKEDGCDAELSDIEDDERVLVEVLRVLDGKRGQ